MTIVIYLSLLLMIDVYFSSQFRYFTVPDSYASAHFATLNWQHLENELRSQLVKQGTVAQHIIASCELQNIPLVVFILFVSEGNNIPEGLQMGSYVNQYFGLSSSMTDKSWVLPPSWSTIIDGSPVEQILFM